MARSAWFLAGTLALAFVSTPSAFAFSVRIHSAVTRESLATIEVNVGGGPIVFSEKAIEEVVGANARAPIYLTQ